ncbi:MBL fold metallo-hydrolase [Wukongibacter baidiensis]|uniref:MBL fold metallo-hydrolase n=1 Tax=Wukongibacter baidiensis TaxID=1723361 RepID=UPI003D7FCCA8
MKKLIVIIFIIALIFIGVFAKNYNPVINETELKKNKVELAKNGIIELNLGVTNCFLIKNGDKYVLIDTGYEYEWDLFNEKLKEIGVSISDISYIILTHHHDDHCGLLNKLTTENNDIRVVMSNLAKELILNGQNDLNHNGGFINKRAKQIKYLKNKFDKEWNELKFTPYQVREKDILITEDTLLKEIGIELEGKIIITPGHSKDSISVIFDSGYCFVGDAAANMPIFQLVGAKYCVLVLEDLDKYYESWKKIISMNVKYILPGHGNLITVEKLKENVGKNKKEDMVSNK